MATERRHPDENDDRQIVALMKISGLRQHPAAPKIAAVAAA
jgi:hypothetical protein